MTIYECPKCGADLDPTQPDCPECGEIVPGAKPRGHMPASRGRLRPARRRGVGFPWGLLIILTLYFGGLWAYLQHEYYNAPEYIAARELDIAWGLLGNDDGRTAKTAVLSEALDHYLAAVKQVPNDVSIHEEIESVTRRLLERGVVLPPDRQREVDAAALQYRKIQEGLKGPLLVGVRDIWDVDGIVKTPERLLRNGVLGGVIIIVLWAWMRLQDYRSATQMALERQAQRRGELGELADHRRPRH